MKKSFTLLMSIFLFAFLGLLQAQQRENREYQTPIKTGWAPTYGLDIFVQPNPSENQREACLSVAFNGWLYAAYTIDAGGFIVARSLDDGYSWSVTPVIWHNYYFNGLDIIVTGTSEPSLAVYVAYTCYDLAFPTEWFCGVEYLDGYLNDLTWVVLDQVSNGVGFYDVSVASDYKYPAVGSSPYCLGVLTSKYGPSADTVLFFSSSTGGSGWDNQQIVTSTGYYLRGVSLSYACSYSYFNGRFFAAWEALGSMYSRTGHIFTSHTDPYFYSPWAVPLQLDNLAGGADNLCRNPAMGTQFNDIDNDLLELTAIVLFDRDYAGNGLDYDVIGMFSKNPISAGTWTRFDIANSFNNDFESDINFDPGANNFLVTYADSTFQQLNYEVTPMNLPDPNNWWIIAVGYNDNPNLYNPYPKVEINPVPNMTAHIWAGRVAPGIDNTTFDAEYNYVGIPGNAGPQARKIDVAPNPCSTETNLAFTLSDAGNVEVTVYNTQGAAMGTPLNGSFTAGEHRVKMDVSQLPSGYYVLRMTTPGFSATGSFVVSK
jgi:hypothetical protein